MAVELVRALELEGHQFTKYIPYYLGQIVLHLQPVELEEVLDYLAENQAVGAPNKLADTENGGHNPFILREVQKQIPLQRGRRQ